MMQGKGQDTGYSNHAYSFSVRADVGDGYDKFDTY